MVVVSRPPTGQGIRKRRRVIGLILLASAGLFVSGALAQRSGILSGAQGILSRLKASMTHPREILESAMRGEDLPELRIDVKYLDMRTIEVKREAAIRRGLLFSSGDDFVPATIWTGEDALRAKIRLKGDILDHIVTRKWSFRIHLRGDDRFAGMRRFSIQHPKTRSFLHEWGFLETMRLEDIIAPRYSFAEVVLNGKPKGAYAVEEAFAKEMIEANRRREGVLIRLDEDPFHRWFHDLPEGAEGGVDVNPVSDRNVAVEPFDAGRVLADEGLRIQWARARTLLLGFFRKGDREASEVFDARMLGRFLAVCELWGAVHPMRWGNVRFYYDPLKDRIEPVAYDGNIATVGGTGKARLMALSPVREGLPGIPWTQRALRDHAVAESYLRTLRRILTDEYVESLRRRLGPRWRKLVLTLQGEFPGEPSLEEPWPRLRHRARRLAEALRAERHVLATFPPRESPSRTDDMPPVIVDVAGVLSVPVEVVAIVIDGETRVQGKILPALRPDGSPEFARIRLHEPVTRAWRQPVSIQVVSRILGMAESRVTDATADAGGGAEGLPAAPSREDCLLDHPFLRSGSPGDDLGLHIRPGRWDVRGDLVLPAGIALSADPGTTLRFGPDAMLVARGPLRFVGTEDRPVVLEPIGDRWRGVAVLGADRPSWWTQVRVRGTSGVARGGWVLTSGVTFHESPIRFRRCRFSDHRGSDDQLNVIRARFWISSCEFGDCNGDAFDGDFVEGQIVESSFHDVGGDAIDLSGSRNVVVRDTVLLRIGDKGLSAGEDSRVRAEGLRVEDVSIAVASKDSSLVTLGRCRIVRARLALAAYRKKPEFGPAAIVAPDGLELVEVAEVAIVQTGSRVTLSGRRLATRDVDVDRLYEDGTLGN